MDYELYHYGVKGMKWGIRRYQRRDGRLTPEGRKRYQQMSLVETDNRLRSEIAKGRKQIEAHNLIGAARRGYRVSQSTNQMKMYGGTINPDTELKRMARLKKDSKYGNKYMTFDPNDNDVYKAYWVLKEGARYQQSYKPKRSLKIAGSLDYLDAHLKVSPKFSNTKLHEVETIVKDRYPEQSRYIRKAIKKMASNMTVSEAVKNMNPDEIAAFITATGRGAGLYSLMDNHKTSTEIVSILKKKGFDGVIDVEDSYVWGNGNIATFPLVVFDNDAVENIGSKRITKKEAEETKKKTFS